MSEESFSEVHNVPSFSDDEDEPSFYHPFKVNAQNGGNAFHAAACRRKVDVEELNKLVNAGVDINARDRDGCTALHLACDADDMTYGLFLIAAGADVKAEDNKGDQPIHRAARSLVESMVEEECFPDDIEH